MTKVLRFPATPTFRFEVMDKGRLNLEDVENLSSATLDSFPSYALLVRYGAGKLSASSYPELRVLVRNGYLKPDMSELTVYGRLALGRVKALTKNG